MQNNEIKPKTSVGEMRKDRETMADGRRYIIYYTFGNDAETTETTMPNRIKSKTEEGENV